MISREEAHNDLELAKDGFYSLALDRNVGPIVIKREIGAKYGLPLAECSKSENIILAILKYLRDIRNHASTFDNDDIHDFYSITNCVLTYDKLEPFLLLESGVFIKFLLDHIYNYLLNKGIKKYTLDNILNISISRDVYGNLNNKFLLDRFKAIKKFYENYYGANKFIKEADDKLKYDLENKILEETYGIESFLENYLLEFIEKCFSSFANAIVSQTKIYNEWQKFNNIVVKQLEPGDLLLSKYARYRDALSQVNQLFRFCSEEGLTFGENKSKEDKIENSLEYFNAQYDKFVRKDIIPALIKNKVTSAELIEIGDFKEAEFGFYYTISYNTGKIYINFILQEDTIDISDMDAFINHPHLWGRNIKDYITLTYDLQISSTPLNKNLNESFNFNTNIALDDYEDEEIEILKNGKLQDTVNAKTYIANDIIQKILNKTATSKDLEILSALNKDGSIKYPVKSKKEIIEIAETMHWIMQHSNRKKYIDLNWIDISKIDDLTRVFFNVTNCTIDCSKWDTRHIKKYTYIFYHSTGVEIHANNWQFDDAEDLSGMFCMATTCKVNIDAEKWNTKNVTSMHHMFSLCNNLNNWKYATRLDINSCRDFSSMFSSSKFNEDISYWEIPFDALGVAQYSETGESNMDYMFHDCAISEENKPKIKKDASTLQLIKGEFWHDLEEFCKWTNSEINGNIRGNKYFYYCDLKMADGTIATFLSAKFKKEYGIKFKKNLIFYGVESMYCIQSLEKIIKKTNIIIKKRIKILEELDKMPKKEDTDIYDELPF